MHHVRWRLLALGVLAVMAGCARPGASDPPFNPVVMFCGDNSVRYEAEPTGPGTQVHYVMPTSGGKAELVLGAYTSIDQPTIGRIRARLYNALDPARVLFAFDGSPSNLAATDVDVELCNDREVLVRRAVQVPGGAALWIAKIEVWTTGGRRCSEDALLYVGGRESVERLERALTMTPCPAAGAHATARGSERLHSLPPFANHPYTVLPVLPPDPTFRGRTLCYHEVAASDQSAAHDQRSDRCAATRRRSHPRQMGRRPQELQAHCVAGNAGTRVRVRRAAKHRLPTPLVSHVAS